MRWKELFNYNYMMYGVLAGILTAIVPTMVIFEVSQQLGWSSELMKNWIFGAIVLAGIAGLILSLTTKLPLNVSSSIPTAVFVGFTVHRYPIDEVFFAFSMAGVVLILISVLKLYRRIERFIKLEIVMAMFAGTIIHYVLYVVEVTASHIEWGIIGIATFILAPKLFPKFPAAIVVFFVLSLTLFVDGTFHTNSFSSVSFNLFPTVGPVAGSLEVIFTVSIPLAIISLFGEVTIGNSILKAEGYRTNMDLSILVSGIATFFGGFFGSHSVTSAGAPVAVVSDPAVGEKDKRYYAAVWASIFALIFGLVSYPAISILMIYPTSILKFLVGLLLLPILIKTFTMSIGSGKFKYAVMVAFLIPLANITIFGIGAQFWALIFGVMVAYLMDGEDVRREKVEGEVVN